MESFNPRSSYFQDELMHILLRKVILEDDLQIFWIRQITKLVDLMNIRAVLFLQELLKLVEDLKVLINTANNDHRDFVVGLCDAIYRNCQPRLPGPLM